MLYDLSKFLNITAQMIFIQSGCITASHILTRFHSHYSEMLVSPSDFSPSPSSNSSQSTRPTGQVRGEVLLVLSRFHL